MYIEKKEEINVTLALNISVVSNICSLFCMKVNSRILATTELYFAYQGRQQYL